MNIKIYYNPQTLLQAAGAGWVWDVTFIIILIGLTISFVTEVFKIQKKTNPDFAGVVWKTILIVLLYRYLPSLIEGTIAHVNSFSSTKELDSAFYKTFSILSGNLNQIDVDNLPDGCPPDADIGFLNFTMKYFLSQIWNFIIRFILFLCLVVVWVTKEVMFSWAWPTLMSLNMLGLCAALVMPAFPGQGFGSVGSFFKSVATFMLWPVIYSVFMFIVGDALTVVFAKLGSSLLCPTSYEFGKLTVLAVTGSIFMAYGIKSIPRIAESIINHRGMGIIGSGAAMTAGAVMAFAGSKAINSTSKVISGAGKELQSAGGKLMSLGKSGGGESGGGSQGFKAPAPKGQTLQGGGRGYSMNQAQDLVSQVSAIDPEKGKELGSKLKQAQNISSGRGSNADKAIKNEGFDSVARNAINFLQSQGGETKENNSGGK